MKSRLFQRIICISLVLCGALSSRLALAAATPWADGDYAQVRLIAAWDDAGGLRAGLQFRLDAGWKTYWRSPGDSGIPTRIDWTGSENIAPPEVRHPIPERTETFGYQTLVYHNQVVLPVRLVRAEDGRAVHIEANVEYAICKEICVPLQAALSLTIDPRDKAGVADRVHARLIDRYAALVPMLALRPEMSLKAVSLSGAPGSERLTIAITTAGAMKTPGLIVEAAPPFAFGAPKFVEQDGRTIATVGVGGGKPAKSLAGQSITLTIYDGDIGIERKVVVRAAD